MNFLFITRDMAVMNSTQVGGGVRSTLLIEALSKLGHVDVISFAKKPVVSSIPHCDVIFSGEAPKGASTFCDWILRNIRIFLTPWNPKGYYRIDKEKERIIDCYYNSKHYDFVVCHFIWEAVSCGLLKYADQLILDVDDNLVSVQKRYLEITHFLHTFKWLKSFWRVLMIGKMQQHLLKRVRLSFYSNESEPPSERSVFLQNVPLLSCPCNVVTERSPMRMLFVGNIDFFPNTNGILHFAESIFPIIKERIPTAELNIVGLCEGQDIRSKLCSINGVNVLGFVDSLQKEYENCRVVIIPLYHGAGSSIKFIEGIMMKRPLVSTQIGARGFSNVFQANEHYLLANTDQEFADYVIDLLSDIDKANSMAREAYKIGKEHFSKNSFYDVVTKAIETISEH